MASPMLIRICRSLGSSEASTRNSSRESPSCREHRGAHTINRRCQHQLSFSPSLTAAQQLCTQCCTGAAARVPTCTTAEAGGDEGGRRGRRGQGGRMRGQRRRTRGRQGGRGMTCRAYGCCQGAAPGPAARKAAPPDLLRRRSCSSPLLRCSGGCAAASAVPPPPPDGGIPRE